MSYKISLSENETFIMIQVFKTITGEMEKEFAEEAIKNARQYKINKFLVDVRGALNVASTIEQYKFGYENMLQFGLDRNAKIAILADMNDESHDFIETLLTNAGYNCRLFKDKDAAIKWLEE